MTDTLDILTPSEARTAVGLTRTDTEFDAPLLAYNTAVSRRMDELCGAVVRRTVTAELHNGGHCNVTPFVQPVSSVTTVVEYWGTDARTLTAQTVGTAPTAGYVLDARLGIITRTAGGYPVDFAPGVRNVSVTYVAGRAATTATVDARFKQATSIVLAHVWRQERGSGNTAFGPDSEILPAAWSIPRRALELIAGEIQVPGIA